jgi:hypothetical protein
MWCLQTRMSWFHLSSLSYHDRQPTNDLATSSAITSSAISLGEELA